MTIKKGFIIAMNDEAIAINLESRDDSQKILEELKTKHFSEVRYKYGDFEKYQYKNIWYVFEVPIIFLNNES